MQTHFLYTVLHASVNVCGFFAIRVYLIIENVLILSCIFVRIYDHRLIPKNGVLKARMRFLVLLRCSLNYGQVFVRVK